MGAEQMKFCGAVARALLIGVKFGGLNVVRIGSRSKNGYTPEAASLASKEDVLVNYGKRHAEKRQAVDKTKERML